MIFGSIILVVALVAIFIAVLQLRQGRHNDNQLRQMNDFTVGSQTQPVELDSIGSRSHIIGAIVSADADDK